MSVELHRTFWPVGHGAFYTEQFTNHISGQCFTAVYDCGGPQVLDCIDDFNDEEKKLDIDLLFISHFHRDHTNGVRELINRANVRQIILPQLEQLMLCEAYIYNAFSSNRKNLDFNSDWQKMIVELANNKSFGDVKIVQVSPSSAEDNESISTETLSTHTEIKSGTNIVLTTTIDNHNVPWWTYVPINVVYNQSNADTLITKIEKKSNLTIKTDKSIDWETLKIALVKIGFDEVKKIYKEIYGDDKHNSYSMPVISAPTNEIAIDLYHCYLDWDNDCCCYTPFCVRRRIFKRKQMLSCLYMGDFETKNASKFAQLVHVLNHKWNQIGIVQVPHHFSPHNHNPQLYEYCYMAFGNIDDYHDVSFAHSVYRDVRNICTFSPIVITECDSFVNLCYAFNIDIRK